MPDNTVKNIITRFTKQSSKVIDYNVPSMYGTYYNINTDETVLDTNFVDTLNTTGTNSGLFWNRYKNIPFYFGEQLQPQLILDEEQGVTVKLLTNIVIPKRHLDAIDINIGDALFFDSVPLDYNQRLFFITNVEFQSINEQDAIKLTLSPHGNNTIEEIETRIVKRQTYNETAKSLFDDDQYKTIENIEDHIRKALRLFNTKFKFGWLPYVHSNINMTYFILDVYTCVIKYIMPLKPKNYNLRYSLILDHEYTENDKNSFLELLFNPRYNADLSYVYTTNYSQCNLAVIEALYDEQVYDTVHRSTLSLSRITVGGTEDLIELLYPGIGDAAKVHMALEEYQNYVYESVSLNLDNIDKSILLNEMIHDYILYKTDETKPFPKIDLYQINQKTNTIELLFFIKIMFEVLHR